MEFDFKDKTGEELETRSAEILREMEGDNADLDTLSAEARAIHDELEARAAAEEARKVEQRAAIANGGGKVIKKFEEERKMPEVIYNASSPEYRSAWLKDVAVCQGRHIFGEMTAEERAAFTHTTANSGSVVPTATLNMIIDLVEHQAPMYEDAEKTQFVSGFGVPRRKSITAGDAKGTAEGTANADDEQNDFDLLSLDGIELKKHVAISRKMKFQSIDAFETWLAQELADRIAVAKDKVIRARLDGTAPDGGTAVTNAGIAAANILTAKPYDDATIRSIFALMKGTGERVVYANSTTIWTYLAGIVGDDGKKLFVPNSMVDPIVQGRIYGATVKQHDELANNVVYFGVKNSVMANDFVDLEIFHTMDAKTAADIALAYSLFDAGLKNPKSYVKVTFDPTPATDKP